MSIGYSHIGVRVKKVTQTHALGNNPAVRYEQINRVQIFVMSFRS